MSMWDRAKEKAIRAVHQEKERRKKEGGRRKVWTYKDVQQIQQGKERRRQEEMMSEGRSSGSHGEGGMRRTKTHMG